MSNSASSSRKRPYKAVTFETYTDSEGKEQSRSHEVGVAWPFQKDGETGFTVELFAMPVSGRIAIFPPKAKGQSGESSDNSSND